MDAKNVTPWCECILSLLFLWKGWVLFTLGRFEFDYHSTLWCNATNLLINPFCKSQCNFNTCKDSVCLLSNLVKHVLIAYGPLGSFFSLVILLYILLSCWLQKSRINLQILSQGFLCIGLDFWVRTYTSCGKLWSESYKLRVKSQMVSWESGWEAW